MSRALFAALALGLATPAGAENWSHRGALALLIEAGGEYRNAPTVVEVDRTVIRDTGFRGNTDVAGMWGLSERLQVVLVGRLTLGGPLGLAFFAGVRNTRGDQLKTYFDLSLAVHALPYLIIGPRACFGVQYELSEIVGLFAQAGLQFGIGRSARIGGEVTAGVQLRSYLVESFF